MHDLRKKLINNVKYNPFNYNFDSALLLKDIEFYSEEYKKEKNAELAKVLNSCYSTLYINLLCKEIDKELDKYLIELGLSNKEMILLFTAYTNRDYLAIGRNISEQISENKTFPFHKLNNLKVDSLDPLMDKINLVSANENMIDILKYLLSYLTYFKNEIVDSSGNDFYHLKDIEKLPSLLKVNLIMQQYYVLKNAYDDCIWNHDGYCVIAKKNDQHMNINMFYESSENLLLHEIGFLRMQRAVLGFMLVQNKYDSVIKKSEIVGVQYFKNLKKNVHIQGVWIKNGYLIYQISQGEDISEVDSETGMLSEIFAFYSYIWDMIIPNSENLKIVDLVFLFNLLQDLFKKIDEKEISSITIFTFSDLSKIPFRIKYNELISYFLERTYYNASQVTFFMNLLCNDKKRIDFWNKPFHKLENGDLLFPLLTIKHPMIVNLLDSWLETSSYSLDSRGVHFENYIKKRLDDELYKKGFKYKICDTKKFKIKGKGNEEIDLILNLDSIVVFAEIKCIKYPLEARDYYSAYNRLENGAMQINRKTKYVKDNIRLLESKIGSIEGKEIVKLVITNYTLFTGFLIHNVPVVDSFLLEAYIISGSITDGQTKNLGGKLVLQEIRTRNLYSNETEFNKNFKKHMKNPPAIEELKPLFEIKNMKITSDDCFLNIFSERAVQKD